MPQFGAHFSVAGGLENAVSTAVRFACPTLQLFTKNASQWAAPPLTDEKVRVFQKAVREAKLRHVTAHDSYLINLAAPGDELFQKSIDAFVVEIERAEQLGLAYLVTHPGAHVGSGEEAGLAHVVEGLNQAMRRTAGYQVQVLLETTAGQGTSLGHRFEHLAYLLENVEQPERFGICVDTCHIFAAGYGLATDDEYDATMDLLKKQIGLKAVKLFHVNDSVKGLGSRVDRHAGLGLGMIGLNAFRRLVTDSRFAKLPMILETPKEDDDGHEMDPVNLRILRDFASQKE
jgi:deoxyribonuclease-4